jgi:SAM-dependent methyltransferase
VTENRFYGELALWWPLISPYSQYEGEATFLRTLFPATSDPRMTMLELGSGGGNNAFYFKRDFAMTLVDLSPQILDVSASLNPECEHLQGDMRTVRLGRVFDTVFVHDAIDYMTTEDDLRAALQTAFEHCRVGGTAVFVPDATTEIYEPDCDVGGTDGDDGRSVRFMSWTHDPDSTDTWIATEYAFVLKLPSGSVTSVHTHRSGLFDRATWIRHLSEVGFNAHHLTEITEDDHTPRDVFVAARPAAAPD